MGTQTLARLKREVSSFTEETRRIRAGGLLDHLGWSDDEHHDIDGAIHLLQDGTLVYIDGALGRDVRSGYDVHVLHRRTRAISGSVILSCRRTLYPIPVPFPSVC